VEIDSDISTICRQKLVLALYQMKLSWTDMNFIIQQTEKKQETEKKSRVQQHSIGKKMNYTASEN
jgi:hypothetical protein